MQREACFPSSHVEIETHELAGPCAKGYGSIVLARARARTHHGNAVLGAGMDRRAGNSEAAAPVAVAAGPAPAARVSRAS